MGIPNIFRFGFQDCYGLMLSVPSWVPFEQECALLYGACHTIACLELWEMDYLSQRFKGLQLENMNHSWKTVPKILHLRNLPDTGTCFIEPESVLWAHAVMGWQIEGLGEGVSIFCMWGTWITGIQRADHCRHLLRRVIKIATSL